MTKESRPGGAPAPNDRELEQYLKGDHPLSRRYRDASRETAPPELDEAVLARARAELRRRPLGINRWLTPVALAASVILGVNLGWNLYKSQPLPAVQPERKEAAPAAEGFVPSPPPAADEAATSRAAPAAAPEPAVRYEQRARTPAPAHEQPPGASAPSSSGAAAAREEDPRAQQELSYAQKSEMQDRAALAAAESARRESPASAQAGTAQAVPAPLTEPQKIDRLIQFVAQLGDATFVRNGKEHGPADAAQHLQHKREKAGDRVQTADDFIRLCASRSSTSDEDYLIRYADRHTRRAEDVLREELARMEGR